MVGTREESTPGAVNKLVSFMDFWDIAIPVVAVTTASGPLNLNNVVVAELPAGITINRVSLIFKADFCRDTSGSNNSIASTTMVLIVSPNNGYTGAITGVTIPQNSFSVIANNSEDLSGTVMPGDVDVSSVVTGNATYYVQLQNAQSVGNNLELHGVQVGVRIYFQA